jgi:outer membrane protein assembly factor BamB
MALRTCSGGLVLLLLAACGAPNPNVVTGHNDNERTGAYLAETFLTPQRVLARGMQQRYVVNACNGQNDARCIAGVIASQPLFVQSVDFAERRGGGVFVATDQNWVYGLRAESGDRVWRRQILPGAVKGFLPRGILAAPVIDVFSNRIFLLLSVRKPGPILVFCVGLGAEPSRECKLQEYRGENNEVQYWVAMLDLRNGNLLSSVEIKGGAQGNGGRIAQFSPRDQRGKPALLLDHDMLYVAFGSLAEYEGLDDFEYHGWVMRYAVRNQSYLEMDAIFCTTPDSDAAAVKASGGGGIWQGGGGLVAGPDGSVYFTTGNGVANFDLKGGGNRELYGDSVVRLPPPGTVPFRPIGAFAPASAAKLARTDADLGSGGPLMIPGTDVIVGGGKSGILYVLDRRTMQLIQDFPATTNTYDPAARDDTWFGGPHMHGSLSYWRGPEAGEGNFYVWGEKDYLKLYRFDLTQGRFVRRVDFRTGQISVAPYKTAKVRATKTVMPGGMLSISANGNERGSGIVWATLPDRDTAGPHPGRLYAFDAEELKPLWDSVGTFLLSHWVPPTIAAGLVFTPTGDSRLIAWELGPAGKPEKTVWSPSEPGKIGDCSGCHAAAVDVHELFRLQEPIVAGKWPSPSGDHVIARVYQGNTTRSFAAREGAWTLRTEHSEGADIGSRREHGMYVGTAPGTLQFEAPNRWRASDGSTATTEVESQREAPRKTDSPWSLLRVSSSEGKGILSGATYIAIANTHGGLPLQGPRGGEDAVTISMNAQYVVYRQKEMKP